MPNCIQPAHPANLHAHAVRVNSIIDSSSVRPSAQVTELPNILQNLLCCISSGVFNVRCSPESPPQAVLNEFCCEELGRDGVQGSRVPSRVWCRHIQHDDVKLREQGCSCCTKTQKASDT